MFPFAVASCGTSGVDATPDLKQNTPIIDRFVLLVHKDIPLTCFTLKVSLSVIHSRGSDLVAIVTMDDWPLEWTVTTTTKHIVFT